MSKVYVTGADGFIGSHLVEVLIEQGHDVTALCIYNSQGTYGWLNHFVKNKPKNLNLILGDVRDPFFLETTIAGHDTVFHLASLIAIPYSYIAPQSYFETNVFGALNLAQACLKAKVKRVIHTSTSEVYGTAKRVPMSEDHPLQGQSPYSASKIGADMLMESYFRSFSLPVVTLRPFNTYGPRQSLRGVIPTVVSQLLSEDGTLRLGHIHPTRDFNFVSDTVRAFLAVASTNDDSMLGQVYNAGSGTEISVRDLAYLVGNILGKPVHFAIEQDRQRPPLSEVERLCCDSKKLANATGWKSQVRLEDGLTRVIEWMRAVEATDSTHYHR